MWLGLAACHVGSPGPPVDLGEDDTGTTVDSSDSGLEWSLPHCEYSPCAPDLALAAWYGDVPGRDAGVEIAAWNGIVLVGAPSRGGLYVDAAVHVLAQSDLVETGRWTTETFAGSFAGVSLAATDLDFDGVIDVAIGEPFVIPDSDHEGAAHLLRGVPSDLQTPLGPSDVLTVRSPYLVGIGLETRFLELEPGAVSLVSAAHTEYPEGGLFAFSADLVGDLESSAAERRIVSGQTFAFDAVDADGDGAVDVLLTTTAGFSFFSGPWLGTLDEADATANFTAEVPYALSFQYVEALGDVTGDGAADILFSSPLLDEPNERAGRVYLLRGGLGIASMPADELPDQFRGTEVGDGMGYELESGDVSGDGTEDVLIGCSGVPPGIWPGKLLVYPGPVAGVLEPDDAAAVVYGEYPLDLFGRSIAVVDEDGDAQADLLVGSQWFPAGQGMGAVYLILGADLLP